uniref:Imidazole glycerol phosphate synthase hisHF n=1 Tax=Albugo laibachii Nc14 TaxID=890382 RepID=F0WVW8_9STRA|nr:unnamed protein product [Albugo laibachii Nc14]|eukprot:CCA25569.1 unnamed protein product [Albugo laibachii Nc14]
MAHVTILDYGAGNVRSIKNAIRMAGYETKDVECIDDINSASILVFPGVGTFKQAMDFLVRSNYLTALRDYIQADRPYLGICLGMQTLFESSEESDEHKGLGIIKGNVEKFKCDQVAVPHIGWNGINQWKHSALFSCLPVPASKAEVYFVHSYHVVKSEKNVSWVLTTTNYGESEFVSSIQKGNVMATQFHPEKSGAVGIAIIKGFIERLSCTPNHDACIDRVLNRPTMLSKRIVACLDVRSNDAGDLVVTKGDQYDVREKAINGVDSVRNMGKPVNLCERYYEEGADEITFLNICSFREQPIGNLPMLNVLEACSEKVFVPLTIGGGIRDYVDNNQHTHSALDVASQYFRAGADKVSIGSDAVYAAEAYYANGMKLSKTSSIETISAVYGRQAVVVSLDPRRVYVASFYDEKAKGHFVVKLSSPGPNGEEYCWYQATVRGGRESRKIDAVEVAKACESMGAGEILLNCVDMDGQKAGYDIDLVRLVKTAVTIPVIASSGAGRPQHFIDVFKKTQCDAALAAGIFHRNEVSIQEVKSGMDVAGIQVRL